MSSNALKSHRKKTFFGQKLLNTVALANRSRKENLKLAAFAGASSALFASLLADESLTPKLILVESFEAAEQFVANLKFFDEAWKVHFFPHWDTMPYDNQSPAKEVLAVRFRALGSILNRTASLTVTTPNALMQKIMPASAFTENCLELRIASSFQRSELLSRLLQMGFVKVDMVEEKGEFSVRGEIIDIFPVSTDNPIRLDFFDDELESMQYFDIETQRSTRGLKELLLYPSQETIYTDETTRNVLDGIIGLKTNTVPITYHSIVDAVQSKMAFPGMESLLPIFYTSTATLLDYYCTPPEVIIIENDQISERTQLYFDEILSEYQYSLHEGNPTLHPEALFLSPKSFFAKLARYRQLRLRSLDLSEDGVNTRIFTVDNTALPSLVINPKNAHQNTAHNILVQLAEWNRQGVKVVIAVRSNSRAERVGQMLSELGLNAFIEKEIDHQKRKSFFVEDLNRFDASFIIIPSMISKGFRWINEKRDTKFVLITEEEIFGLQQKKNRVKKSKLNHFFSSLGNLNTGDYVVHVEYGIGQYEGLKKIKAGTTEADFLVIVYQDEDKVYVPVDKFYLVQKYSGVDSNRLKLNKLGNRSWAKTKSKVKAEINEMANELMRIAAERKAKKGVVFSPESTPYTEFSMSFPYQETEDQEQAIMDVMKDMGSPHPMDRLVCGDVGFGKTEVAMRAAFRAVLDGYQVSILAPTTILAQQHFNSLSKRFENYAIKVGLLSRFQTPKKIKKTLQELAQGRVDIAIGTHRLFSKDVVFKNLGLLVIDEEQRFGVKHKEIIRQIRTTVDTLTLSATPIPRTLHMSLTGIRDISVINTPPIDRRAIRTRLTKFSDYVIKEAVNREIRRNGQIFFIHNRVESIYQVGQYLNQLLPRVRIAIAHGQMAESELEKIMMAFINGEYDLLLATTIVESGLDIPNVNTIIVNNSDQFGLSQLYQLRGRVGRSSVQAYAYLLIPREKMLTDAARKRLTILRELNHLGAGFKIASYDLELRGAGNILGPQQSGHIIAVGFEMYTNMIEEAVNVVKRGQKEEAPKENLVKLNLGFEANLPDSYITGMNQRLDAYKTISSCKTEDELWDVRSALEDRFGRLPKQVIGLFHSIQIKLMASKMAIAHLNRSVTNLEVMFTEEFRPDPIKITGFLTNSKYQPKLLPGNRIKVSLPQPTAEEIMNFLFLLKKEVL